MLSKTKTPKELINESWKNFKDAWMNLWGLVWNTVVWTYKTVDALDKVLGNAIWEKSGKLANVLRNNIIKTLLGIGMLTYGWTEMLDHAKDNEKDKQEQSTIQDEDKEEQEESNYHFEREKLSYRDNPKFEEWLQRENPERWIHLIKDKWLSFYVVQPEDIKEKTSKKARRVGKGKSRRKIFINKTEKYLDVNWIRAKLMKLPEYDYLKRDEYQTKTKSFNVPWKIINKEKMNYIEQWNFFIPIPIDSKYRQMSPEVFAGYCYDAIQEIKKDKIYWEEIKNLLKKKSEKDIVATMLAFARSETAEEYTTFKQNLWTVELHRREDHMWAFSYTYFHILMEKNRDWTNWPWLKARLNLWLSEWECYHPKNSAKLFLWYWIEKLKSKRQSLDPYFPITNENLTNVARTYNWSASYAGKLWANYRFSQRLLNWEIKKNRQN